MQVCIKKDRPLPLRCNCQPSLLGLTVIDFADLYDDTSKVSVDFLK